MLPSHPELLGLQFEGKRFQNSSHGAGVDPFAGSGDGRFDRKNKGRERRPMENPYALPKESGLRRCVDLSTVVLVRRCDAMVRER